MKHANKDQLLEFRLDDEAEETVTSDEMKPEQEVSATVNPVQPVEEEESNEPRLTDGSDEEVEADDVGSPADQTEADAALAEDTPIEATKEKKKKRRKKQAEGKDPRKPSRAMKIWVGIMTFLNIGALACFFIAYGPFSYLRDLYVTTAMKTMTHKYLANVLYSNETIKTILSNNTIIEPDEIMDASAITIGNIEEPESYSSVYEQQVLEREDGNDVYKTIELKEHGYRGWITFIYDPHMVQLAVTKHLGVKGQFVTTLVKQNNAYVGINAGGFKDYGGDGTGGIPSGYVIQDGKVLWKRQREATWGGGTIGFSKDGVMILTKKVGKAAVKEGVHDGVDFGPFLKVNGKAAEVSGNGGWGVHPRTIIGQRQDGIVVFLVVDGRSTDSVGIDLNTAIDILNRYNVYNAANLDGGASSAFSIDGKLINHPTWYTESGQRETPTAWIVVDPPQEEKTESAEK